MVLYSGYLLWEKPFAKVLYVKWTHQDFALTIPQLVMAMVSYVCATTKLDV